MTGWAELHVIETNVGYSHKTRRHAVAWTMLEVKPHHNNIPFRPKKFNQCVSDKPNLPSSSSGWTYFCPLKHCQLQEMATKSFFRVPLHYKSSSTREHAGRFACRKTSQCWHWWQCPVSVPGIKAWQRQSWESESEDKRGGIMWGTAIVIKKPLK